MLNLLKRNASHSRFREECSACGLPEISAIEDGIPVLPGADPHQEEILEAVIAAHGLEISSDECLALRSLLGPDSPEWDAYVDVKLEATRESRRYWYFHEADDMFMDAMATMDTSKAAASLGISKELLDQWIARRQEVADAIPPGTIVTDKKDVKLTKIERKKLS